MSFHWKVCSLNGLLLYLAITNDMTEAGLAMMLLFSVVGAYLEVRDEDLTK